MQKVRCAIYTRKSTDEGLEKEFNSLEAQYEAGLNYIKSQVYKGWEVIPERYDDGGYSGGNINRPALQKLLDDVRKDKIDMIVVYKIDRLTRSLTDFSKLVDVFDAHQCSFVSVTQNFNTYDSMGRLTLNMLLSFAQFEREVDAERIRDKVAASRKKGMWMGGRVPFGYNAVNKKLLINPEEAEIVKLIYNKYCCCRSVREVGNYLRENNYKTADRLKNDGTTEYGQELKQCKLNHILSNPIYIGKVVHKGTVYDGQHEAIISQSLWDKVQEIKKNNSEEGFNFKKVMHHSLLRGLVECGCCHSGMILTYTSKKTKKYNYYTSSKANKEGHHHCEVGSIGAGELDALVLKQLHNIFRSPRLLDEISKQVAVEDENIGLTEITEKLKETDNIFDYLSVETARAVIERLVSKIVIYKDKMVIRLLPLGTTLLEATKAKQLVPSTEYPELMELHYSMDFRRRNGHITVTLPEEKPIEANDTLVSALVKAFAWKKEIDNAVSVHQLAKRENISRQYLSKILKMVYLAPDIVEAILVGTQPSNLKLTDFFKSPIPVSWAEQRRKYGFS